MIVLCAVALVAPPDKVRAQSGALRASITASPSVVLPRQRVTYTLTLRNAADISALNVSIAQALPPGFTYIGGSAQILSNRTLISTQNPTRTGDVLTWSGLSVPLARSASYFGMHTFVQDRCEGWYIAYQLDRVRELMGPGAYVKQLFYRINPDTPGPQSCWVEFVNACYDRDLIPIVRLQGEFGGPNWNKPPASAPGDYTAIAQAYARVVAGLPRRGDRPLFVEVWNEPNLDIEWGGEANPVEYAHFLVDVAAALRALGDRRIVVLNGALSPGGDYYSLSFIDAMATVPGAMEAFDVWAAHPYPGNHPPEYNIHDDTAPLYPELTIDGYMLELARLAAHGRSNVRVLLTETGYALGQNNFGFQGYPPIDEANRADYIARAFRDYWSRWPEVWGVCPFELVDPYGDWPMWDWLTPEGGRHQQYDAVLALDKTPRPAEGELMLRFQAWAAEAPGTYRSQISVTSSNLGGVALSDAAPVQVLPPPPTATPTYTPTLAGTPTWTLTPSPTPLCYPALLNGSFERDGDWEIPSTAYPAGYSSELAYRGARSMRIGIVDDALPSGSASYSSARQAFYIPPEAVAVRIRFWHYLVSRDTGYGRQYALLLDQERRPLQTIIMWSPSRDNARWEMFEYEVTGRAGQTLWLQFGVFNDGEHAPCGMYVDEVELEVCGPQGFVTLTPTPSPSATPSRTLSPSPTLTGTLPPPPTWTATPGTRGVWLPLIVKDEAHHAQAGIAPRSRPQRLTVDLPPAQERQTAWARRALFLTHGQSVRALAFDAERRRLVAAQGRELTALDAGTGELAWRIALRSPAHGLALDEDGGTLYATLPERGELAIVSPRGDAPPDYLSGLGRPTGVAAVAGRVYLADSDGGRVIVLDRQKRDIIQVCALPAAPYALAYDPVRGRLYVGLMGHGALLALNAKTMDLIGEVRLGGLGYPLDLALDAQAGKLYVAHSLTPKYGALSVVDVESLSHAAILRGRFELPLREPNAVRLDRKRGLVWVGHAEGLAALDMHTLALRRVERVARSPWGNALAYDPERGMLYLADDQGRLWVDGS